MKRVAWLAGTGAVALLVIGGVLLLMANLYVQSPPVQARIRQGLSASLKMPAEVRKTTFTPWDGLRIDGITAPAAHASGSGTPATAAADPRVRLSADSFRARFGFWSLLTEGRLVVREILFDSPTLAWVQSPAGRWRWPSGAAEVSPEEEADESPAPGPPPPPPAAPAESSSPAPAATAAGEGRTTDAPRRTTIAIQSIKLRHGALRLLDRNGAPVGRFEDVNVNSHLDGPDSGRGQLWFARSTWGASQAGGSGFGLAINRFESPFTFSHDEFHLAGGRGEIAGGGVELDYAIRQQEPGSPFRARGALQDLALDRLLKDAGVRHDLAAGKVRGEFEWSGLTADVATQTGQGRFRVIGGELRGVPLLGNIGEVLGIEELQHLRLQDAQADCRLEGATLRVDPLTLASGNLRLEARGQYGLDRPKNDPEALDLQARLTVGKAITRQLPQFIEDNFLPVADSTDGSRYLDFRVSGPLSNPRTDLLDRAVAKPLRSMLQGFLGGGGGEKEKRDGGKKKPGAARKAPADAAARPTPDPSVPPAGGLPGSF